MDVSLPQVAHIVKELDGCKPKIPSRKSTISADDSFFEKKEEFIETIDLNPSVIRQSSFTDKRSLDDSGFETFSVKKSKERSSFLKKQRNPQSHVDREPTPHDQPKFHQKSGNPLPNSSR